MRATLRRLSPVFTRPTNSWISFGLVPAASMVDGLSISCGMGRRVYARRSARSVAPTASP